MHLIVKHSIAGYLKNRFGWVAAQLVEGIDGYEQTPNEKRLAVCQETVNFYNQQKKRASATQVTASHTLKIFSNNQMACIAFITTDPQIANTQNARDQAEHYLGKCFTLACSEILPAYPDFSHRDRTITDWLTARITNDFFNRPAIPAAYYPNR